MSCIDCITAAMTADTHIIVFARALEAGGVKTRLIPALGAGGALSLYERMLDRTLQRVADTGLPGTLCVTAHQDRLAEKAGQHGLILARQRGAHLGERMIHALCAAHDRGFARVLLVGSDCPVMEADYLLQAESALAHSDAVLGPAEDGGYVLIGSARRDLWHPGLLDAVRFGGDHALADTRAALEGRGRIALLDPLWDLDDADDLARARALGLFLD